MLAVIPLLGLLTAVPATPSGSTEVVVEQMHIVFERKGSNVKVTQSFQFSGKVDKSADYTIQLPSGAFGPSLAGNDNTGIELKSDRLIIRSPILEQGLNISVQYNMALQDGSVVFDQKLEFPVASAQVISTWTAGNVGLSGRSFIQSELHTLSSGLQGLVIQGNDISGRVHITLTGLKDGPEALQSLIAFILSAILLAAGFLIWLRAKMSGQNRA